MISEMRITAIVLFICFLGCKPQDKKNSGIDLGTSEIKAIDISFYPQIIAAGYTYKNAAGYHTNFWDLLKSNGINTIRLRLWNDPTHPSSSISKVAALAKEAKQQGLDVILDFHYSATWADPGKQTPPSNWQGLNLAQLKDSVYQFTYTALLQIPADFIQLGNELNGGFLWPLGNSSNVPQFLELYRAALKAAREANPTAHLILHFAGQKDATWFYSQFEPTDFDIVGLSYYPYWHGKDFSALVQTLTTLKQLTQKEVMILETAYPFTLAWKDYTNNVIGDSSQLMAPYPATIMGQAAYLKALRKAVQQAKGLGVCYWGAEWVAYKGDTSTSGSSWENQALWNFEGKALLQGFGD
jgi:arabinogalactan endo-1,4-beta-galactosidase